MVINDVYRLCKKNSKLNHKKKNHLQYLQSTMYSQFPQIYHLTAATVIE